MDKKILLIAAIITMSLISVTTFAADSAQVGSACAAEAALCCSGNKSTMGANLATQVWNSSFVINFEMKVNGSGAGDALGNETRNVWLELNNSTGQLANYTMVNHTGGGQQFANWTLAVTGLNSRTAGLYTYNIIANNTTGDQVRCMAAPMKFGLTRATATSTLVAYDTDGNSITSYTAPDQVRVDCTQAHSLRAAETILPTLTMTLTYPSGWTGSTVNPAPYVDNSWITLTPIGAGASSYVYTCTYTTNENYSTGTAGTLTFTVNPGGNVIILPGTQPVEQPGFFSGTGGIWDTLNAPIIAGIPLWIILLIVIGIFATQKKKMKFKF